MKRIWFMCALALLAAVVSSKPSDNVLLREKRSVETVMFGNQQNQAHKSVKKSGPHSATASGPPPPSEKGAETELEKVGNSGPTATQNQAPPTNDEDLAEMEYAYYMNNHRDLGLPNEELSPLEEELMSSTSGEKPKAKKQVVTKKDIEKKHNLQAVEKKSLPVKKEAEKKSIEKKNVPVKKEVEKKATREEDDVYSYFEPGTYSRRKRHVSQIRPSRSALVRMSSESSMAAGNKRRRKRDLGYDPRELAQLRDYLASVGDGYDNEDDEMTVEPRSAYEFDQTPYEASEELVKREMDQRIPENDPLLYQMVTVGGVQGLFIPVDQPKGRLLQEMLEDREQELEQEKLEQMAKQIARNEEKRSSSYFASPTYDGYDGYDLYKKK